ncbi:acyltransferase family protein [Pseudoduganella chitinolytica]|uniref:Acyltransferase n=1 Tax=Pseudoduganella chitinolytica TaxID=34070 RepID=A0ABY8B826_9BURK|nr:acyltransferase [Pseudoduganella chitinolytica]WEF31161.1 acyltransferase [Pseudoduganella chitinolytica]
MPSHPVEILSGYERTMKIEKIEPGAGLPTNETAAPKKKNFSTLNWLRFLAALYIVLFHTLKGYGPLKGTWLQSALSLGNMATSVFFVLSGFLLTYAYVVQKNGRKLDRRNFLLARFSNLYPLHIVGLMLSLLPLALVIATRGGVAVPAEVSGTGERIISHAEFVVGLVMNLLLLNAWNPFYMSFNYPSWSLSALGCYYLLFPVIAPKVYRMKGPVVGLVVLGVLFAIPGAVADLLGRTDVFTDGLLHRNPIVRFPLFLAGMMLCVHYARAGQGEAKRPILALCAVILVTAAFGIYLHHHEHHLHLIRNGMYYPASLAVIWLCVCVRPSSNPRVIRWGERLGAASLPMFLLHGPIFQILTLAEKFVRGAILSPDWRVASIVAKGRDVEPSVALYWFYLAGLVLLCVYVQERWVAPLQVWIRNRYGAVKAPPAPVVAESRSGTA